MSLDIGDLEGILTGYALLLDKWSESAEVVGGWEVDFVEEVRLVEGLYEKVLELQGRGVQELVGR